MTSQVGTAEHSLTPPTKEFTAVWIAYALFAVGAFMWWPALLGLVICYSKRGAAAGFIDTHHRWLIRTFWFATLAYLLCIALVLVALWPMVAQVLHQVGAHGDPAGGVSIQIDWSSIFSTAGGAMACGIGFAIVWIWYVYRVVRGMLVLGDARPLP